MITKKNWGGYTLFLLENENCRATVSNLGATLVSLSWRGKERVIGYGGPGDYLSGKDYVGATVGRYANRIGGAAFELDGRRWSLTANEGNNQLHGGSDEPWHLRCWQAEAEGERLCFSLLSEAGDNGFPGTLRARVIYSLTENGLRIDFEGETDADTHYAPTNHSYFDLSGEGCCLRAKLQLAADRYLAVDGELIPTAVLPVEGTAFDFRREREIGQDYDHCFVLSGSPACTLSDGDTAMHILTDFPAVQIYTGSGLNNPYRANSAVAIEPEFFPDSPNHPEYPSTLLRPGERFHRYIAYQFEQRKAP